MTLFQNKKVVVMGLGLHGGGVGVAKFFCQQGADVLVTDLKTKKQLKESIAQLKRFKRIKYVLGKHRKEDFKKADLIIKNPDVPKDSPYLKIAKKYKVPIETDVSIFFELSKAIVIGITGTKGKSTTATLIYRFLKSKYPRTFLAGNIGTSPLELLSKVKKGDKVVLELSSFELEDLKKSPQIAVLTNILPDHLNRYKSMREYIEAKKRIFKFQDKNDILVLNYDDPVVKKFSSQAKSRICFFSSKKLIGDGPLSAKLYGKSLTARKFLRNFWCEGKHNLSNISAAIKVAELLKVPYKNIENVLKSFKGVPFRQEFIREVRGVKYFNDTTATMPDAVCEAIKTIAKRFPGAKIILIAGGQDKGLNYKEMAEEIKNKVSCLVLLPGTASDKLKKEPGSFKGAKGARLLLADSMQSAVKKASKIAKRGDIVLLSPGAASFNLFKNEFDRGEQFNKYVKTN